MRILIPSLVLLLTACDPPTREIPVKKEDPLKEQFILANRYMQRRNQDHIAAFVERVGWDAQTTSTGLWIVKEEEGRGQPIRENDRVTYTFSSTLLDGTPCYEAGDDSPRQIVVGRGGVESGVEEGLRHLREGSRAVLIIPPHLAHGNFGDRQKVPGNSILIYRLVVKEVKRGL